ncbi:MAG: energy transducer TonB [Cyanobacteria bacterium P01_E01_bin.42]
MKRKNLTPKRSNILRILGIVGAYIALLTPTALASTDSSIANANATDWKTMGRNSSYLKNESSLTCLHCPRPEYPREALERGIQGTVKLTVEFDDRGNVTRVSLEQSSGSEILDIAALEIAREWKFKDFGQLRTVSVAVPFEIFRSRRDLEEEQER